METTSRLKQNSRAVIIAAVIPATIVGLMLFLGWRRWPDILVDFGRELYLPWQVSTGKVLYRDIDYYFGPFSVYLNATLFSLFGASFTVLFTANIFVYSLFMVFLFDFVRRLSSLLTASATCSVVAILTLSQFTLSGNYNFISPYSHEAIHGLILSLVLIDQLWRFSQKGRRLHLVMGGALLGCVLLTRLEIAAVALVVSLSFFVHQRFFSGRPARLSDLTVFFLSVLVPLLIPLVYFTMMVPVAEPLRFLTEPLRFMLNGQITGSSFYRSVTGLDNVSGNLLRMLAGGAIFLAPLLLVLLLRKHRHCFDAVTGWGVLALYWSVAAWFWSDRFLFPALPLIMLVITLFLVWEFLKAEHSNRQRRLPLLLLSLFALGMLGKMLLNCRVSQYGFYAVIPAVVVVAIVSVWYLPAWLQMRNGPANGLRNAVVVFLAVLASQHLISSSQIYKLKTFPIVGAGNELIFAMEAPTDPRGALVAKALQWIDENMTGNETLLVLPEGVMLNFLVRRDNPSRYFNFMMPELLHFGEKTIVANFTAHPPDVIMLILAKDTTEYGVGPFGLDPANGKLIVQWVESAYRPVMLFGGDPLEGRYIGVKIYRRVGVPGDTVEVGGSGLSETRFIPGRGMAK